MGLSAHNMKRWIKMLAGRSIEHVNQGDGRIYSTSGLEGYYNDLTEKVTKDINYSKVMLPILKIENGSEILFPIAIFQYGLGAYDLFLITEEKLFLDKFKICVDWACDNQRNSGAWNTFFFKQKDNPYSAMAQGEGISLLVRAYKEFHEEKYLLAAKKAVEFLIVSIDKGGVTKYNEKEVFLQEVTNKPTILNGWIFSIFGLYDYLKVVNDENIRYIYELSVQTMIKHLNDFDNGYWSKYDMENMIASPFYHELHISQLNVMYKITGEDVFRHYSEKWTAYKRKPFNRYRAFITKAMQKLAEK